MALCIVFTDPVTGNLAISHPILGAKPSEQSEADYALWVAGRVVPVGVPFSIENTSIIPADRTYRDAWKRQDQAIVHDLPRCKAIHKKRLLRERDERLEVITRKIQQHDDDGDLLKLAAAKAKRKTLRDLDGKIETDLASISNLDALKVYRPSELDSQA